MTITRAHVAVFSANESFKSQYQRTLRWSALAAMLATALLVWVSPRYTPQPYQLRPEALQLQEVEIIYEIKEPPKVAAAPIVHPEIIAVDDDDPGAVDIIELPPFHGYIEPRVNYPVSDTDFVASSRKPQLVFQVKPHYPEVARLAEVEGTVVVKVLVDIDGSVKAAEIVNGVHPLLNKAALAAARKCVFKPGQQREIKVPTWVAVPYNFRLR